jgi:tRNA modification GTPase
MHVILPGAEDTIAAIATASGRGAIAIVRMEIASHVVAPWPLEARHATLCAVHDPATGALLDRALVTVFDGSRSFTGEPTVEIATHGGTLVPSVVLGSLIAAGARQAQPGEFTRRAVVNGRIDLLQAEAIGDLIDARSRATHRSALHQLDGGLSRRVRALRDAVIDLEALIAYDLDFPDEDDGPIPTQRVLEATDALLRALDSLLATADTGELIRDGALVVLAGPPNAGKSSLFNALLGHARAIVTEVPGTTRDALEGVIDTGRWPLRLVDTAGLRETTDVVERLGVEVSERYLAAADVILACSDDGQALSTVVTRIRSATNSPIIAVRTKSDVTGLSAPARPAESIDVVSVSAHTGSGLEKLMVTIGQSIARAGGIIAEDQPLLTRARHRTAIRAAFNEVEAFRQTWVEQSIPGVVAAVHLRAAATSLEELIGSVDVEDILDRVFATFCVGK